MIRMPRAFLPRGLRYNGEMPSSEPARPASQVTLKTVFTVSFGVLAVTALVFFLLEDPARRDALAGGGHDRRGHEPRRRTPAATTQILIREILSLRKEQDQGLRRKPA